MNKSEKSFLIYSILIINFLFLIIITSMVSVVTAQSYSPAPQYAYITNFKDGTAPVIDAATNTVTNKVKVGQYPVAYSQFMATHPLSPDQRTININPHDSEAWDRDGGALVALNKHNEALKAFDKALEINPQDSIALDGKGLALTKLGKSDEAIKAYDRAIEVNPQDSIALKGRSALSNIGSKSDTMTELTCSTNQYTFGQTITFTAKVDTTSQGPEKPSGNVTFRDGNTQIGTEIVNSGQAILTTSSLSTGSHSITAQYIGNNNFKPSTSSAFTLTVNQPGPDPQPRYTENVIDTMTELTSPTNKSTFGQSITFIATIGTPSQGVKKPSGTVIFLDGNTQIGTETINYGKAILTTSTLSVGPHSITAKYIGDNNFKPSTSSILTIMILNQSDLELQPIQIENPMFDTVTVVTSSANEYTSDQPITFTAKIDTMSQRTEKPSGTVTFIDGNTQIGTETVNSGQAILTTSSLSVGSHSITAQYIGNNNFKPSTSSAFTLTVKNESMFKHPLFPVACGIVTAIIGGFIRSKIQKKY
jgi:YVTN family beta-propeller protein